MDSKSLRQQFPALKRKDNGQPVIWVDAPGGTQVPQRVIDGMSRFLQRGTANLHGDFAASAETDAIMDEARHAAALLLGAKSEEEVHFGQNTSSLHFALSHSLAKTWRKKDVIIVTNIDHDANIRPWVLAAETSGATVRTWTVHKEDGQLHLEDLEQLLDERVVFVAVTAAANVNGSIMKIKKIGELCHQQKALLAVDAVHFAPHRLIDVQKMGCDILTVSAYKFFGPHIGIQWIKQSVRESLPAYKVLPAPDHGAARFETGTQNFEALAGLYECVAYIGQISGSTHLDRKAIIESYKEIRTHEDMLSNIFFTELQSIPGLRVLGHGAQKIAHRTPTFACLHDELPAKVLCTELAAFGIYTWAGHFYALDYVRALDLEQQGILRIGFAHYHTCDEVRRVAACLRDIITALC